MTLVLALAVGATRVAADDALSADEGPTTVVVSATRTPESSLDVPVAIDRVSRSRIQWGQLAENLSESLAGVPGASVENRQNYAQDLQISIRGFGARSNFGVRGVRLVADGIPATMPDGQGQVSQFDLGSADHIEVLRGPFSALYGNSSGGVIALFTEEGAPGRQLQGSATWGPFGTQRYGLKASGTDGTVNYVVDAAHFATDGYRDHSAAQRNHVNALMRWELRPGATLTFTVNGVQTPFVQDPLGLTQAQLTAAPSQAGTNASVYDTRKNLSQEQLGIAFQQSVGPDLELSALLYAGHRATTQFQAILQANELQAATHPGGVIDLARRFGGSDLHAVDRWRWGASSLQLTAGFSYDDLLEARRGYLNFVGTALGVEGALRRNLDNQVYDLDQYAQLQWDPGAHWRVLLGARHSAVSVNSLDHLAAAGTPGSAVEYTATNPVAGVTWRLGTQASLYGAYGRGFETPTLNDLAYRSINGNPPGLNTALAPAKSANSEIGFKATGQGWAATLAGFAIDTHNELAVLQNSGGRAVFQNLPQSQRRGLEAQFDAALSRGLRLQWAYTWLRAQVATAYRTCIQVPCPLQPQQIVATGYRLPAIPENALYAAVSWRAARWGLSAMLEAVGRARIYANDLNTQAASGFWDLNLKLGWEQANPHWRFSEYVRVDNLADRRYVDSVIVNESNARYFEPDPGRTLYLLVTAAHH